MNFNPNTLFLAGALLLMAVLAWFNGQPVAAGLVLAPWDLLAHFAVFFVLALLLLWGLGPQHLWLIVLLAIAYAAFDELRQLYLPGRHAEWMDFAADVLAVAAGMAIGLRLLRFPGSCLSRNSKEGVEIALNILRSARRSRGLRPVGFTGCVASLALALAVWAAQPVQAASTPVALAAGSPELTPLAACMAERAMASGPVLNSERLVDGLEFRMLLRSEPGAAPMLIINGLLKPDVAGLIESHNHDDHPESQSAAATRFYRLLRIPLGSRAWVWRREQEKAICGEAAAWIESLRRRPINYDRLGPDGELR